MKKKIIYISGAESFDIQDVKEAFEEVRNTLKLDSDTLLFGVPVEEFMAETGNIQTGASDSVVTETVQDTEPAVVAPVEKPKRTSRKKAATAEEPTVAKDAEPVAVAPILSVLAPSVADKAVEQEPQEIATPQDDTDDIQQEFVDNSEEFNQDIEEFEQVEEEQESVEVAEIKEPDIEQKDVVDMINDDMPADETEKTLEELLETMEPLREDVQPKNTEPDVDNQSDTTLESLASEFVESQDNFLPQKKNTQRSKIGKLKNILPFKKLKREDPGIMGDLFGWAGIAANDEDFTIPGFFTGVASKK